MSIVCEELSLSDLLRVGFTDAEPDTGLITRSPLELSASQRSPVLILTAHIRKRAMAGFRKLLVGSPEPIDFRGVPFPERPPSPEQAESEDNAHQLDRPLLLSSPRRRDVRGQPFAAQLTPGRKRAKSGVYQVVALFATSAFFVWMGSQAYMTAEMDISGSLSELRYQRGNYYDIHSAPRNVIRWVGERLLIGKDCATRSDALIAKCCASNCGGFSDRERGLGALLLASESVGRRLCIAPDYFIAGARDKCDGGVFIRLGGSRTVLVNTSTASANSPVTIIPGGRKSKLVMKALEGSKYVASGEWSTLPQLGLDAKSSRKWGRFLTVSRVAKTVATSQIFFLSRLGSASEIASLAMGY